jgi:carbon storage regulator
MLVLARKSGEGIVIGDTITVDVLEVRGGRVRLGFTGPGEISIVRSEIRQPSASRERDSLAGSGRCV